MPPRQQSGMPAAGWLLMAALTLLWGVNWPILKIGVAEVPVFTFRVFTGFTGAVGLGLLALAGGMSLRVPRAEWRPLVVAASLNITGWNILMLYGVSMMASGRAAILAYTMPLWASLLGVLVLGDRLTPRRIAGLACGLTGMAVLLAADWRAIGAAPAGALCIVGAAMVWGAGTVAVKHYRFSLPTTVLVAWQQLIGTIPILFVALALDLDRLTAPSLPAALAVAYNMFVASIFCYWAWFKLVGMAPVVVSTVSTLMIPVVGVVSGALILGEEPGLDAVLAMILVAAALLLVLVPPRRRQAATVASAATTPAARRPRP